MVITTTDAMDAMEICLAAARRATHVPALPSRPRPAVTAPVRVVHVCTAIALVAGGIQRVARPEFTPQANDVDSQAAMHARSVGPMPGAVLPTVLRTPPARNCSHERLFTSVLTPAQVVPQGAGFVHAPTCDVCRVSPPIRVSLLHYQ